MHGGLSLPTRIGLVVLVSLVVLTAAVTGYVVLHVNPRDGMASAPDLTDAARPSTTSARDFLFAQLARPNGSGTEALPERHITDLLPNQEFSVDGAAAAPLAAGVVVGTVASVAPGRAYTASGAEESFASSHAVAKSFVLTITVERGLGAAWRANTMMVGLTIASSDYARVESGLRELGHVIIVIDEPGRFGFAPSLPALRGVYLGSVSASGHIAFPALADEKTFLNSVDTVDELVSESSRTLAVRHVTGGMIID